MSTALFSKGPCRVEVMKGFDAMPDANLQECLQRPFYLFARGKGRACRKEIWVFAIFVTAITSILSHIYRTGDWTFIPGVVSLVLAVPQYALTVRRLHDLKLSGWLALIPWGLSFAAVGFLLNGEMSKGGAATPSAYGAVICMIAAVVTQLVVMCVPSRYKPPTANNS